MTTEKNDGTFQRNVSDTIRLLQDSTKAIIEAQSKQFAFATEVYHKLINTFGQINRNNTGNMNTFPEGIVENIQRNFEIVSTFSKETFSQALAYNKQTASGAFSRELIENILDVYQKQAKNIATVNQQYIDALPQYFKLANTSYNSSLGERLKKDLDENLQASKAQFYALIESYRSISDPTFEYGTVFFNELNDHINTTVNVNLKLWLKLLNAYSHPEPHNNVEQSGKTFGNERKKTTKEAVEN